MQIEIKRISDLVPAPYNPRKISKKDFEALKSSITEFGYIEPIIWNKQTGNIVGRHQRLKALVELGMQEAECVIIDVSEEKEKVLNIALNKISGEWDKDKLAVLFEDLKLSDDIDLSFSGFNSNEIETFLSEEENSYFGDERENTYNIYRLNEFDNKRTDGYYQIPILKACHYVPDEL